MRISTHDDLAAAIQRLQRRSPAVLAAFIVSLAHDSGPVGEQVRTFIVGDAAAEAAAEVIERLRSLKAPTEYTHRHALGREIGTHLDYILDSIETLVLPVDTTKAFELLVAFFEADSAAMENCGEHHWEVQRAFERATVMMMKAAKSLPRVETVGALQSLIASDGYGVRGGLAKVIDGDADES